MNIFNSLKTYSGNWSVKDSRDFSEEEKKEITKATVVSSSYGNSVCFAMKSGSKTYIPLSRDSQLQIGDKVDLNSAKLLTLERSGEADIYRVEA